MQNLYRFIHLLFDQCFVFFILHLKLIKNYRENLYNNNFLYVAYINNGLNYIAQISIDDQFITTLGT